MYMEDLDSDFILNKALEAEKQSKIGHRIIRFLFNYT